MRVINKNRAAPVDHPDTAAVLALLNGRGGGDGDMSFDEIRAALGRDDQQLSDGAIHQIALDNGFEVVD